MHKHHVFKEKLNEAARRTGQRTKAINILLDKQKRKPLSAGEDARLKILLRRQELADKDAAELRVMAARALAIEDAREAA